MFRTRLFAPIKSHQLTQLTCEPNKIVLVPGLFLKRFETDANLVKVVQIFSVRQAHLSISSLDYFALEILGKITKEPRTKFIFDCSSISKVDLIGVRLLRALIIQTIVSGKSMVEPEENQSDIRAVFILKPKLIQLIYQIQTSSNQSLKNAMDLDFKTSLERFTQANEVITDTFNRAPRKSLLKSKLGKKQKYILPNRLSLAEQCLEEGNFTELTIEQPVLSRRQTMETFVNEETFDGNDAASETTNSSSFCPLPPPPPPPPPALPINSPSELKTLPKSEQFPSQPEVVEVHPESRTTEPKLSLDEESTETVLSFQDMIRLMEDKFATIHRMPH